MTPGPMHRAWIFALVLLGGWVHAQPAPAPVPAPRAVLDTYCVTCHNDRLRTAGLALDRLDVNNPGANAEVWEKVIAKLRAGSMPPPGRPRPDGATYPPVASPLDPDLHPPCPPHPNPRP